MEYVGGRGRSSLHPVTIAMAKPKNACKVCCVPCCMTACFVLVLIPLLVFLLSLVFAAVMWSVECEDLHFLGNESIAIPWSSYAYNYGDTAIDDRPACDLYQWFLYVCGNLVGLGNPLTNVGPKSGNHMAEILDLMVAVWSLAITGTVIGMIGGLAAMNVALDAVNGIITRPAKYALDKAQADILSAEIASGTMIDINKFTALVIKMYDDKGLPAPTVAAIAAEFARIDADGDGVIDEKELERLQIAPTQQAEGADAKLDALATQVAGLEKMLIELSVSVTALREEQHARHARRKSSHRQASVYRGDV